MKPLWPHQRAAIALAQSQTDRGRDSVIACPTGGGKSLIMACLTKKYADRGVDVYINRRTLLAQLVETYNEEGIPFSIISADYPGYHVEDCRVQLCSSQTVRTRCLGKRLDIPLPTGGLVLVDEIHMQKGAVMQEVIKRARERGAVVVVLTATPVGLDGLFEPDDLIIAGTHRELRNCKAHLPAHVYAPSELDTEVAQLGKDAAGRTRIFGHILEHWKRLNPQGLPTIAFAPYVRDAVWVAEQFVEAGVGCAHVDGEDLWVDGEWHTSNHEKRREVIDRLRDPTGDISVVTNAMVYREGVDIPELYHVILAVPYGSLATYRQAVGRVLRYTPRYDHVIVQDHGGNWWRHGSPNSDPDWRALWPFEASQQKALRFDRIRQKAEPMGFPCPHCDGLLLRAIDGKCHYCQGKLISGHQGRKLVQLDGRLKKTASVPAPVRPRREKMEPTTQRLWQQCFYRMKRTGKTFNQAMGLFFHENKYWPPRDLPLMPKSELNWYRRIRDVPVDDLR